jgi:hypothetical protein
MEIELLHLESEITKGSRRHQIAFDIASLSIATLTLYDVIFLGELKFQSLLLIFLVCVVCSADLNVFIAPIFLLSQQSSF